MWKKFSAGFWPGLWTCVKLCLIMNATIWVPLTSTPNTILTLFKAVTPPPADEQYHYVQSINRMENIIILSFHFNSNLNFAFELTYVQNSSLSTENRPLCPESHSDEYEGVPAFIAWPHCPISFSVLSGSLRALARVMVGCTCR